MSIKVRKAEFLDAAVISSLVLLVVSFGNTVIFQKTYQQEDQQNSTNFTNNSMSNQTNGIANQYVTEAGSIGNQTLNINQSGTAALSANMTQADFESLKLDLTEARQALENNDTTAVLDELSSASGELFQVISNQFDPVHVEAITQEFNPLQTHIDQAQEEALKGDRAKTMEEVSAAESELLKITQMLPASQE